MDDLIDVEMEDGTYKTIHWPFCEVKGCMNRQYFNSKFCYPHTKFTDIGVKSSGNNSVVGSN
jgi:hypothetical protein